MKKYRFEYFASCPSGLEEHLAQELLTLGAKSTQITRGGAQFEAFHEVALKVILHSRLASRVFKYLYQFEMENEKDFYLEATELKWKSLMQVNQTFKISTIFGELPREREDFRNSQFATLKLKDAIVDYFRHFDGERPSVAKDYPEVSYLVRIERGQEKPFSATLMYDLVGEPLHQRGYRIAKVEAPLKENLAAGILKLVNWQPANEVLMDPMCGSGTIAIEALLMAANIPPSYLKVERYLKNRGGYDMWTFLNYSWFTEDKFLQENFQKLCQEVLELTEAGMLKLPSLVGRILASDLSQYNVGAARDNFQKARVLEGVILEQKDALETVAPAEKCLFICNPPYGERLEHGEEEKLKALYKGLGDHWKHQFKGHRAALFTGNLEMLKVVGLKTSKRIILWNGDIECRLAEYNLY